MKNGSIEFVAVMCEKFKTYVQPYVFYEFMNDYDDFGFGGEIRSKRECKKNNSNL